MRKTVITALLALVATAAYAEQWKLVESDANRTMHYIDENSVTKNGPVAQYWAKSVYPHERYTGDHTAYTAVKRQYLAQCKEESQVAIAQVFYDRNGNIVNRTEAAPGTKPQANDPVIPGSYQEWMLENACRHDAATQAKISATQ